MQPPIQAMLSQRLTVRPCASFSMNVSSRVFFTQCADLVDGLVPADVVPMIGAGPPHLRLQQAPRIQDVLLERSALGTQRAAIDGMVGVALDVNHLRRHVLGFVADRVNEDAAAHGAIRTGRSRLGGAGNLELFELRHGGSQIESQERNARSTNQRALKETSAGDFHCASSDYFDHR